MKKEALAVIMATTLLVLSLLSPVAGAVSVSYAADSGGDSVSISESYDVDDTTAVEIKEDLIRSQDQLLKSLGQLIWDIYENVNYNVSIDQKKYSLKRFEDLLVNQSEDDDLLEWLHEQDPPLEDPQPGFCGIYRNFIPTRASGGHPDFNCDVVNGPSPGLIENNPPWRPTSPPQIEDDWYHTASCLVTIDPAVAVAGWPGFIGLDFTPDINAWSNIHPELDERIPGDPCYFTAHWETTITVADWLGSTPVTFQMCANDDSWFFLDGELIIDRGGGHEGCPSELPDRAEVPLRSGTTHAIDLFYAERCNITPPDGMFEFGISPGPPQVIINDPSEICAKKSFEDLLKRQAERIKSFEDLFETIPPSNRTFELFESFENLTKEQGELLKSFEGLIKNETPPPDSDVNRTEENYLLEAELVNLLDSFEDLLHSQYELIESFDDLLDESKEYLFIESELNFTKLLFSKEDLIRSQDQLLESFEQLIWDLFENVNYNVSIDQKEYFLKSFEDLLMNQSELLKKFEVLLEWWYEQDPPLEDPQPGFWGIYRNFDNKTRNDFGISAQPWGAPFTGLVADNLPCRPSGTGLSFSPSFATPPDWYKTPSSLIRIDPAITVPSFGPDFIGLNFNFLTDYCHKEPDFPEELDEGLPGDPCHFTVHWETRITTKNNITSINLTVGCDDDCWVYANGDLIVDCGGIHGYRVCSTPMPVTPGGTYDIDIFYTERYGEGGNLRFGISPDWGITINCPKELCAKKSFEDLLKRQAERIKSFEDLFETIPPSNRTFELFESFENLTKEQGELLKSFERLINNETPPPDSDVNRTEENYLLEAELVNLLDSFEDLLHSQYELIESFGDLLDESKQYLFNESELNFTKLLFSKEDLIRSQDQLLESFEQLIWNLFENVNYNVSVDQKEYFLKSFEDLLMNQSELLKEFEVLLEWWWYKHNLSEPPQVIISDPLEICAKTSFEDLLKRQEERIKRFEELLKDYSAVESDF